MAEGNMGKRDQIGEIKENSVIIEESLPKTKQKNIGNAVKHQQKKPGSSGSERPELYLDRDVLNFTNKKINARSNLIGNLKDRGLKGPLKWSKWVSEVQIQDYRNECRQLGDPLLFTHHHHLPTPLCKKEETTDLNDTNSPMATFSYYLRNDRRVALNKKANHPVMPGIDREVSISELHRILKSPHVEMDNKNGPRTANSKSRLQISIEKVDPIAVQNSSFSSLPKVKLTLKPGGFSNNFWKSFENRKFKSHSWDNMYEYSSDAKVNKLSSAYGLKQISSVYSFENESDDNLNWQAKQLEKRDIQLDRVRRVGKSIDLKSLNRPSRSDITRDWIKTSPLGPAKPEIASDHHIEFPTPAITKSSRKVRFGGNEWIYRPKDPDHIFDY